MCLRGWSAGPYGRCVQVVAHGARIVGAHAVQIQVEYPVSAYADLLVGVLFRNRWRCPHVTLHFTVSQYVSRQAAVWSLAVRRFDEPSSYASSRYRLSAIVSCVMPVATFRTNGYTGQIITCYCPDPAVVASVAVSVGTTCSTMRSHSFLCVDG